jgi:hypothetical protein
MNETNKEPVRLVYLGTTTLSDNKPGELWTTEALALAAKDTAELRATSSAFSKRRTGYTVGAIYESPSTLNDDGRLVELNRALSYRAMIDTEAMSALVLQEKGVAAQERAKKAEEKARKDGGPSLDSLLDQVARIVARAPFQDQPRIISGFSNDVQRRALEIWKKGR